MNIITDDLYEVSTGEIDAADYCVEAWRDEVIARAAAAWTALPTWRRAQIAPVGEAELATLNVPATLDSILVDALTSDRRDRWT